MASNIEVRRSTHTVGGVSRPETVHVAATEFVGACVMSVRVKSTGLRGGDAGHGGFASVEFKDEGSTCIGARVETAPNQGVVVPPDCGGYSVRVEVRGDAEALMLADAMEFAATELRRMLEESR